MIEVTGKFILVNQYNKFFDHVSKMLLEYYDNEQYTNTVFILGTYCFHPYEYFQQLYPDKRIIIYQLEQLYSGGFSWHSVDTVIENIRPATEIWDYDVLNIKFLEWKNIKVDKFVPFRYTNSIYVADNWKSECDIDILFYGFINERRFKIFNDLQSRLYNKYSIVWLYGIDYEKLDEYMARSKIILNLHISEPYNRQEQVRMFYPIINKKCVISEKSQINYLNNCILETEAGSLVDTISYILENNLWRSFGEQAHEFFKLTKDEQYNQAKIDASMQIIANN